MSRGIGVLALALLACGSTVVLEPGPLPGEPLDAGVVVADGGPSMPPPTDAGSATPADGGGGAGGFASDSGGGNVGGCGGGLVWARTFGGSAHDRVHDIAIDAAGNIVMVGTYDSQLSFDDVTLEANGVDNGYVVKLSPDGAHLWSKNFGGGGKHAIGGLTLDSAGNILVSGTSSSSVDLGGGTLPTAGGSDAFIVKLSSDGAHLWSKLLGGAANDRGGKVAIAPAGNLVFVGEAGGAAGAQLSFGGPLLSTAGSGDIFITMMDASGAHLWSKLMGGPESQGARSVAVDSKGNIAITGGTGESLDFGTGPLGDQSLQGFVAMLDAGASPMWGSVFPSSAYQGGFNVAFDSADNMVAAGLFAYQMQIGGGTLKGKGGWDIYLVSLDPQGQLRWGRVFGNSKLQSVRQLTVTSSDRLLLTGPASGSVDFGCGPVGGESGSPKAVFTKLDNNGATLYNTVFGDGFGDEVKHMQYAQAAAPDGQGDVVVAGVFSGSISFGSSSATSAGQHDLFLAKLSGLPQ